MEQEKLIERLAAYVEADPKTMAAETSFESLGIDSLDTVELIMDLEDELGIELEVDEKITTIGELAAFIEQKLG